MKYCQRCLYPANQPLGLTFDEAGVCSGCRVHEEKDTLNWAGRRERLRRLLDGYRSRQRNIHDCVVPVSGARDSYFIVHTLKHEFGMHPLLVNYNAHWNTKIGIRNLAYLRTLLGCDCMQQTLSPEKVKRITRASLALRGSIYWHVLAGRTVFPVQVAVRFKIPLIVWGAHQGLDQVGMFSHTDEVEMTRKYRKDHDLMGLEAEDLARAAEGIDLDDLEPLVYPHDKELAALGVRGIYLGNYIRWDSKAQHEAMIRLYGYEAMRQQRTFDTYNDVDCWHYSGLHDYIKDLKWGYGKATDHACREIRLKRMTREEGMRLVAAYQDIPPADAPMFAQWLGMTTDELFAVLERHRNPAVWRPVGDGRFERIDSVVAHRDDPGVAAARLEKKEDCSFALPPWRDREAVEDRYVLIGRGWVENAGTGDACRPHFPV